MPRVMKFGHQGEERMQIPNIKANLLSEEHLTMKI